MTLYTLCGMSSDFGVLNKTHERIIGRETAFYVMSLGSARAVKARTSCCMYAYLCISLET